MIFENNSPSSVADSCMSMVMQPAGQAWNPADAVRFYEMRKETAPVMVGRRGATSKEAYLGEEDAL